MNRKKRMILLAAILVVSVGLDQWSKIWADESLGTVQHPVAYTITAEEAGRPVGELIIEKAGLNEKQATQLKEKTNSTLTVINKSLKPKPEDNAFRQVNGKARLTFYWAFHHETRDMPPRRIPLAQNVRSDPEKYGDKTIQEYLKFALPYLSDDARERVLKDHLFAASYTRIDLAAPAKNSPVVCNGSAHR